MRIPGNLKPHSVAVHPSPSLRVAVGWKSPVSAVLRVEGRVQHAHPECGNGIAWSLELRRGAVRQKLAAGVSKGAKEILAGPIDGLAVQPGDLVSLLIAPRDGNHSCDLTAVDLTLAGGGREWNLAREVSPNILAGNPHADGHGNARRLALLRRARQARLERVGDPGRLIARPLAVGGERGRETAAGAGSGDSPQVWSSCEKGQPGWPALPSALVAAWSPCECGPP